LSKSSILSTLTVVATTLHILSAVFNQAYQKILHCAEFLALMKNRNADASLTEILSNRLRPPNSTGLLPQSTHLLWVSPVDLATFRRVEGSPRDLRGFGSCERQFRRRENGAQTHVDPFHREVPEPQERHTQEAERQIERAIPAQGHVRRGQRKDAVEA
jgi:hypothetical protein